MVHMGFILHSFIYYLIFWLFSSRTLFQLRRFPHHISQIIWIFFHFLLYREKKNNHCNSFAFLRKVDILNVFTIRTNIIDDILLYVNDILHMILS